MQQVIDFDNPTESRLILDHIRSLKGRHRVEVVRYHPRRTDRQNNLYWPSVVMPFAEWLSEQYGEKFEDEDAHYLLKKTFLSRRVRHPQTGKVVEVIGSTTQLDTAQFTEYYDKCSRLLAEYCGIEVRKE